MTLNKKSLGILKEQPATNECCSELYTTIWEQLAERKPGDQDENQ